jgi:hypothetical protein
MLQALGGLPPRMSPQFAALYPWAQASTFVAFAPEPLAPSIEGQVSLNRLLHLAVSP